MCRSRVCYDHTGRPISFHQLEEHTCEMRSFHWVSFPISVYLTIKWTMFSLLVFHTINNENWMVGVLQEWVLEMSGIFIGKCLVSTSKPLRSTHRFEYSLCTNPLD